MPAIIGLYGLPGSGKSFLLKKLQNQLDPRQYTFYEGSELIASLVTGGLAAFQKLDNKKKQYWREQAMSTVAGDCYQSGRTAIVTGHFMFPAEGEYVSVCTAKDLNTYTHIIYLKLSAKVLSEQILGDTEKVRRSMSVEDLETWQQMEVQGLTRLSKEHDILFSNLAETGDNRLLDAFKLIQFSRRVKTVPNMIRVNARVDEILSHHTGLETMLVFDGDKTLCTEDAGMLCWKAIGIADQIVELFKGPLGYSETTFLQAMLLCEETIDETNFEGICKLRAAQIKIHPEFIYLLRKMKSHNHVRAVVATCGIRRLWELVLEREGFSETVKVIGGARISDDMIVTPIVKAHIVSRLKGEKGLRVWAFGDSPLDLPMLEEANEAIVVTGELHSRSRSMEKALLEAIEARDLRAQQTRQPGYVPPRLTVDVLPEVYLTDPAFLCAVFSRRQSLHPNVWHTTDTNAARLLMSPARDASVAGSQLRRAHGNMALYLAWSFLSEKLGVEEYPIQHVQGHQISGHRLRHEQKTTIVALMRGGEPMALSLSEAFPLAMFVHAASPNDVRSDHVENQETVILVDSVINSGKTLIDFISHTRSLSRHVQIIVVAGVVQADAILQGRKLAKKIEEHGVLIGALRLSENKFTGVKGTDTGHRLFNTTHMD
ncbi:hypothetical protein ED733_008729 [Metarhizium rileyi]|uniref:Phosphoribosyltransferase domain-containing protein n=1 Tax=Metarhizium rileyi (strain RCEF 4871) TaxID=1649241 RepID=A0A5C6GKQ4_METRR|nr:hypothetical protein ED733_008729 [Metarhizium rileyi]